MGFFRTTAVVVGLAAAAIAAPATAATQIFATSYDMPNGDGQASGGSSNYWDKAYSGSGSTTTDGAALSGGLGDLTDGVVAATSWNNVENPAGTGPYVGWYRTVNPLITFHFAGLPTIDTIAIHLDNTSIGGVYGPAAILVDGVSKSFTLPTLGTIGTVTLSGLGLTGASHTVQFQQQSGTWTFVSEVSFYGESNAVPEPAAWALMITGFGAAGAMLRRRRALA